MDGGLDFIKSHSKVKVVLNHEYSSESSIMVLGQFLFLVFRN